MDDVNFGGDSEKPLLSGFELHSVGGVSPHFILLIYYFAFSELISVEKDLLLDHRENWSGIKHFPRIIH